MWWTWPLTFGPHISEIFNTAPIYGLELWLQTCILSIFGYVVTMTSDLWTLIFQNCEQCPNKSFPLTKGPIWCIKMKLWLINWIFAHYLSCGDWVNPCLPQWFSKVLSRSTMKGGSMMQIQLFTHRSVSVTCWTQRGFTDTLYASKDSKEGLWRSLNQGAFTPKVKATAIP